MAGQTFLRSIPNLLSIARGLGGLLLIPIWFYWGYAAAAAPFFCLIITDALDGFIARAFGFESRLGSFLDPLADKLLTTPILLFVFYALVMGWSKSWFWFLLFLLWFSLLVPLLIYEVQSTWRRILYYHQMDVSLKAKSAGKFKVLFIYAAIGTTIILGPVETALFDFRWYIASIFLTVATICAMEALTHESKIHGQN